MTSQGRRDVHRFWTTARCSFRAQTPETDTYTVRGSTDLKRITAVRLEALPHDRCRTAGRGEPRTGLCRFERVKLFQEPIAPAENVKFVRVELPDGTIISRCRKFKCFAATKTWPAPERPRNRARRTKAHARLAIDGSTHPHFATGRRFRTRRSTTTRGGRSILREPTRVDRVVLWNEDAHPYRLIGFARVAARRGSQARLAADAALFAGSDDRR